jgi:hypothetical protein
MCKLDDESAFVLYHQEAPLGCSEDTVAYVDGKLPPKSALRDFLLTFFPF